jgi:hypothetical protein
MESSFTKDERRSFSELDAASRASRAQYIDTRDRDRDKLEPPYMTQHTPHAPGAYAGVRTAAWEIHGKGVGWIREALETPVAGVTAKAHNVRANYTVLGMEASPKPPRMLHEFIPQSTSRAASSNHALRVHSAEQACLGERVERETPSKLALESVRRLRDAKSCAAKERNARLAAENRRLQSILATHGGAGPPR